MNKVYRSGLIPYWIDDNNKIHMMFMLPSDPIYGGDKFQISKGKVEDGEDNQTTAVREAQEELGLMPCNIKGDVWYLDTYLGRTSVYVCRIADKHLFGVPGYETGDTTWMTVEQFENEGRDLHVAIVRDAYNQIVKIEYPKK